VEPGQPSYLAVVHDGVAGRSGTASSVPWKCWCAWSGREARDADDLLRRRVTVPRPDGPWVVDVAALPGLLTGVLVGFRVAGQIIYVRVAGQIIYVRAPVFVW
jgi:hypothetical protein